MEWHGDLDSGKYCQSLKNKNNFQNFLSRNSNLKFTSVASLDYNLKKVLKFWKFRRTSKRGKLNLKCIFSSLKVFGHCWWWKLTLLLEELSRPNFFTHFTSQGPGGGIESPDMTEASRGFEFQRKVPTTECPNKLSAII